jgi:hypothetical protein
MGKRKADPLPARLRRVLDEAEDLFSQEGFLHFSTNELVRRLRCFQARDLCGRCWP